MKTTTLFFSALLFAVPLAIVTAADDDYEKREEYRKYQPMNDPSGRLDDDSKKEDRYKREKSKKYGTYTNKNMRVLKENEALFRNECGSCHMAYQPEFLPKRSWKKMMATLEDHFKTDATMDTEDHKKIEAFLIANASDSGSPNSRREAYREISRSIPSGSTPISISETRKFKKEHREIPIRLIRQKEVKSIANCAACHRKAEQGYYGERDLIIPNYGRWDD
ncbi:diheme cytochrome c [Nitratifractor sp.]